jgi:four helix bundle suffix protein
MPQAADLTLDVRGAEIEAQATLKESQDEVSTLNPDNLIPAHGGYRDLRSFQIAQLVYDLTVRFCENYVGRHRPTRTHDQMVQAARSGVQNIAEGSQASATSKKTELRLTSVARASLEELRLDYEDYLRQHRLILWNREDPRRDELFKRKCTTADAVAQWVHEVHEREQRGHCGRSGQSGQNTHPATYPEIAANAILLLITVACSLLDRQLASLAATFQQEGGFSERLYRFRRDNRLDSEGRPKP